MLPIVAPAVAPGDGEVEDGADVSGGIAVLIEVELDALVELAMDGTEDGGAAG